MIKSKEDRIEHLSSAILFIMLFFFLICGFSTLHERPFHHKVQPQEQIFELHSNTVAVYLYFQHPSYQKSQVSSLTDKMNFKIFNAHFKVLADNSTIYQKIIALQKVEIGIKPLVIQRFYHPYLCIDSEDLPILS
jgi:hypothetical protein